MNAQPSLKQVRAFLSMDATAKTKLQPKLPLQKGRKKKVNFFLRFQKKPSSRGLFLCPIYFTTIVLERLKSLPNPTGLTPRAKIKTIDAEITIAAAMEQSSQ